MNTPIRSAYFNALLADASYVEGLRAQDTGQRLEDQLVESLTAPLAKYVGAEFTVLTQFTDPRGSGFSVTVFADRSGTQYISFRGTEPGSPRDWFADIDAYFGSGLGRTQIIAMVNWYLRASTPANMEAVQMLEVPVVDQLTGEVLARTVMVQGEGTLPAAGAYVVNGHSLGGHLTTVFSRLFSERVLSSHTFNGLGVGRLFPEGLIGEVEAALGLGITSWATVDGKQKNYYAQYGVSIATTDWWLQQRGERIALFNEAGVLIPNHLMYKLTDALALQDVLGALDNGLSITNAIAILNAGSSTASASLESVLDALRRLYRVVDQTPTKIGDTGGNAASRADYHAKLADLRAMIGTSSSTTVALLVGMSADALKNLAINGDVDAMAYRYALKELNPFAVFGPATLYQPHNSGANAGVLDLYTSPAATPAGMTTQYLTDRAAMLAFLNAANTNDTTILDSDQVDKQVLYTDLVKRPVAGSTDGKPTNLLVSRPGSTPDVRGPNVVGFGTDSADVLQGRDNTDRLYGGGGTDALTGGKGNDYLEGGAGLDLYQYRGETSIFSPNTNDGDDEIRDTDGKGLIRYTFTGSGNAGTKSTVIGSAAIKLTPTQWQSPDGKFTYDQQGSNGLRVTINGDAGGSLMLRDFDFAKAQSEGYLGIRLVDTRTDPANLREPLVGDLKPLDTDPLQTGDQLSYDDWGNVVTTSTVEARNDALFGRDDGQGDKIEAKTGNDIIFGDTARLPGATARTNPVSSTIGAADWIQAGAGRDYINAGPGDDLVEAGADGTSLNVLGVTESGGDVIEGGLGNDEIYGNQKLALADAISQGNQGTGTGLKGDFLAGGAGEDILIGGAGRDTLIGGFGEGVGAEVPHFLEIASAMARFARHATVRGRSIARPA